MRLNRIYFDMVLTTGVSLWVVLGLTVVFGLQAPVATTPTSVTISPNMAQSAIQGILNSAPAGTEIIAEDGNYSLTSPLILRNAGINLHARNTGMVRFVGPAYGSLLPFQNLIWNGIVLRGANERFAGCEVDGIPYNGVSVEAANCQLEALHVHHCGLSRAPLLEGGQGVMFTAVSDGGSIKKSVLNDNKEHAVYPSNGCSNIEISDCEVYHNGYGVDGVPSTRIGAAGIQINGTGGVNHPTGSHGCKILRNRVSGSSRKGIHILFSSDGTIEGNIVYGNGAEQIAMGLGSKANVIRKNQVVSGGNVSGTGAGPCLLITNTGGFGPSLDNILDNNMFWAQGPYPSTPISLDSSTCLKQSTGNILRSGQAWIALIGSNNTSILMWQAIYSSTDVQREPDQLSPAIIDAINANSVPITPPAIPAVVK